MIVSHLGEARRFIGRLDPGQDIVAAFRALCRENSVLSAWIMASAVLRGASVAQMRKEGDGLKPPAPVDGAVFCPTVFGSVSLDGDSTDVRLYGTCHAGERGVTGVITAGEVRYCEFLLVTSDDLALVRQANDRGGFAPWVQLKAAADVRLRAGAAGPLVGPAPRPAPGPAFPAPDDDEASELNILDMKEGDHVDHPRFGVCRVVHGPVDDKVSIRLPTGKHVDLHLGVMRVLHPKQVGGRRVFQVEVRRKDK